MTSQYVHFNWNLNLATCLTLLMFSQGDFITKNAVKVGSENYFKVGRGQVGRYEFAV